MFSMAGTLILSVTYGIDAKPSLDPFIQAAEVALKSVTEAARPGAFLVVRGYIYLMSFFTLILNFMRVLKF